MSARKEFEEFCRKTRPPMSTSRDLSLTGWGDYTNVTTKGAWRAWKFLMKQAASPLKPARAVKP